MNQESFQALQAFLQSAMALSQEWNESLDQGYPFNKNFEEVIADMQEWIEKIILANRGDV